MDGDESVATAASGLRDEDVEARTQRLHGLRAMASTGMRKQLFGRLARRKTWVPPFGSDFARAAAAVERFLGPINELLFHQLCPSKLILPALDSGVGWF